MVYYKKSGSAEVVLYFGDRLLKIHFFTSKSVGSRHLPTASPRFCSPCLYSNKERGENNRICVTTIFLLFHVFENYTTFILLTISFSGNTECLIWIPLLQTLDFYYWIVLKNLWKELCYFIKNDRLNFQNVTGKIVIGKNSRKFMR